MSIQTPGHYYIHENGSLIYKPLFTTSRADLVESPFVKQFWYIDSPNREDGWKTILLALHFDVSLNRVKELVERWSCTAEDLPKYLCREENPTPDLQDGLVKFIEKILCVDPDTWLDWLEATPDGEHPDFSTMPRKEEK